MGILERFMESMKLNVEDEEYEDEYEEYEESRPRRKFFRKGEEEEEYDRAVGSDYSSSRTVSRTSPKITPMRSSTRKSGNLEVRVVKPTSFEGAKDITEVLLTGRAVILNLEGLGLDIAQRIIDFSCGSAYAINGDIQKVSNYIFIVTPPNVDISGDFLELVDSFDFSGSKSAF